MNNRIGRKERIETYDLPSFRDLDLDTRTGVPVKLAIPLATKETITPDHHHPYRMVGQFRRRIQQVIPLYVHSGTDSATRPAYLAGRLSYVDEKGELVDAYTEGSLEIFKGRFCPAATKRDVLDYLRRLLNDYQEDLIPVNKFWLDQRVVFSETDGKKFKVYNISEPTGTDKCYILFRRLMTEMSIGNVLTSLRLQSDVPQRISKNLSVTRETFFKVINKKFGITPDMIENEVRK